MKVTTEQLEDRVAKVIIEVDDEEMRPALEKAARQASGRFQIPGFRKGRAPYHVVAKLVGDEYLYEAAAEDMAPALVERALKEQEIVPFAAPTITDFKAKPMSLTVSVPLEPTAELGEYHDLHIEREVPPVTDEDVDAAIDKLRKDRGGRQPIERPIAVGDWITGHLTVRTKGADGAEDSVDEDDDFEVQVPPSGEGMPGLSEHVVGANVGDLIEFDSVVTVSGDETTTHPAHITFELKRAEEEFLPDLDDEFAVLLGDYEDLAALRAQVRERLEREKKEAADTELRKKALEAIVSRATLKYPPAAVEMEMDRLTELFTKRMASLRVSMNAFLKSAGLTKEQLRETQRDGAKRNVEETLALRAFIEAEGIAVTPEEITARADRILANAGPDPRMAQMLHSPEFRDSLSNNLLMERAMRRLISLVTGEPEEPEEDWTLEDMPAPAASVIEVGDDELPGDVAELLSEAGDVTSGVAEAPSSAGEESA